MSDNDWDDAYERVERASRISVGIIVGIVIGTIVFLIASVVICIYCVCKRRQFSSGTVVQRGGAPAAQPTVTTYSFQSNPQQPMMGHYPPGSQPPPPGYSHYPPPAGPQYPQGPQYPAASGPAQPGPPMVGGGWVAPNQGGMAQQAPYAPKPAPMGFAEHQKASAPPME